MHGVSVQPNVLLQSTACRCGMAVPAAAASNPSVWGVRTWVPLPLLQQAAAAAGMLPASSSGRGASSNGLSSSRGYSSSSSSSCDETGDIEGGSVAGGACPALMRHFALELQRQLSDPVGHINKQVTASACNARRVCQAAVPQCALVSATNAVASMPSDLPSRQWFHVYRRQWFHVYRRYLTTVHLSPSSFCFYSYILFLCIVPHW
jgi:hypothetical protein